MPLLPKLSENGAIEPEDHDGIEDADRLIRRISEQQTVFSKRTGRRCVSSMAYQGYNKTGTGMSVDIEKLIIEDGKDPVEFVTTPRWFCSVVFDALTLRGEELRIGPVPEDNNPYHGEVWGNYTDAKKRRLKRAAKWYVPGKEVDLC